MVDRGMTFLMSPIGTGSLAGSGSRLALRRLSHTPGDGADSPIHLRSYPLAGT